MNRRDWLRKIMLGGLVLVAQPPITSDTWLSGLWRTIAGWFRPKPKKVKVEFKRIITSRYTLDVEELRTWRMDIRAVLSDNAIKDAYDEMGRKMLERLLVPSEVYAGTDSTLSSAKVNEQIFRDCVTPFTGRSRCEDEISC